MDTLEVMPARPVETNADDLRHRPFAIFTLARCMRRAIHHLRQAYDLCVYDDLEVSVKIPNGRDKEVFEPQVAWLHHWECCKVALRGFSSCATILSTGQPIDTPHPGELVVTRIKEQFLGGEYLESVASRRKQVDSREDEFWEERSRWEDSLRRMAVDLLDQCGGHGPFNNAVFQLGDSLEQLLCPLDIESALHSQVVSETTEPECCESGLPGGTDSSPRQLVFNSAGVIPVEPGDLTPGPEDLDAFRAHVASLHTSLSDSDERANLELQIERGELEGRLEERIRQALVNYDNHTNNPGAGPRPRWDGENFRLKMGEQVARTLKPSATNCIAILAEFEEEGWPERINDPLPLGRDPERLSNTLRTLNKGAVGIRFSAGGDGESITWRPTQ